MRIKLKADPGMVYTNGEIYGTEIDLAEGMTSEGFYQITSEEYAEIQRKEIEKAYDH